MPTTPEPHFSLPPRSTFIDCGLSAAAFAFLLGAWAAVYVTVAPADPAPARHIASLQVRP